MRLTAVFDVWAGGPPARVVRYHLTQATVDTLRQAKLLPEAAGATS